MTILSCIDQKKLYARDLSSKHLTKVDKRYQVYPPSHPQSGSSDLAIPVSSVAAGNRNKGDPSSVWSSLFLRIDSLLLSKCIDEGQAAALRRLAWSRDVSAAEVFADKRECSDKELSGHLLRVLDGSNRLVLRNAVQRSMQHPRVIKRVAPLKCWGASKLRVNERVIGSDYSTICTQSGNQDNVDYPSPSRNSRGCAAKRSSAGRCCGCRMGATE